MQAKEGKNEHDDYDQTDDVNYSIHDGPPGRECLTQLTRITVPLFRSSSRKGCYH
jgi:hypothetical protein